MNGLLCCAEILGVLLFIPLSGCKTFGSTQDTMTPVSSSDPSHTVNDVTATVPSVSETKTPSRSQNVQTTQTPANPSPTPSNSPWTFMHLIKHYPMMIIICGVLILVCTILLISTLMLTVKVCQLSRRLRTLGSNGCLVVDAEHWMGMDKRNQAESQPEAKENTFLLAGNSQTNPEVDNSATKEDGGKASEDGQNGEQKKEGEAQESEEGATPATPEDSSPSSKPEEEAASSETPTVPPPPSSTEDTEKPKKDP